jgi:hypothetical protein
VNILKANQVNLNIFGMAKSRWVRKDRKRISAGSWQSRCIYSWSSSVYEGMGYNKPLIVTMKWVMLASKKIRLYTRCLTKKSYPSKQMVIRAKPIRCQWQGTRNNVIGDWRILDHLYINSITPCDGGCP